MDRRLLVQYIKLCVAEAHEARVPNQLLSGEGSGTKEEVEDVNEFAAAGGGNAIGTGGLQGFNAPLGAAPQRKKQKKRRKQNGKG